MCVYTESNALTSVYHSQIVMFTKVNGRTTTSSVRHISSKLTVIISDNTTVVIDSWLQTKASFCRRHKGTRRLQCANV